MSDQDKQSDTSMKKLVEEFTGLAVRLFGLVAGAIGLVYAAGFVIVNISLLSYGVYEVALVRTRYVSAGVAFLAFVTILAVLAIATRTTTTKILASTRFGKSPTAVLLVSIFIIFILSFLLAWLSLGLRGEVFKEVWKAFLPAFEATREFGLKEGYEELEKNVTVRLTIWCFLLSVLFLFVISDKPIFFKKLVAFFSPVVSPKSDANQSDDIAETGGDDSVSEALRKDEGSDNDWESNLIRRTVERHLRWPIVAILLIVFLYFYGLKAYATFPAALGGGLPIVVQFSATEADLAELSHLGIRVDPIRPGRTQRVALLAQTDTNFIVLVLEPILKKYVAVSLPKSDVDGIVYYPEEYWLNDDYIAEKSTQDGQLLLKQDNPDIDAAIDAFEKARRRIPNYVPALLGLGDAYQLKEEQNEAKQWYSKAEEYICDYLEIQSVSALGDAYVSLEEYDRAITVYQRALPPENQENVTRNTGCPNNKVLSDIQSKALLHYKLAQTYAMSQQYSKVAAVLSKAMELDETAQEKEDYREAAKTDPVFNHDNLRLDREFLETIFVSLNDAVSSYEEEGDRLRREENELEAAVTQYTWAISLTLQLEDYDSAEEAKFRFLVAGVDLMLWDGANMEEKASYQKEAIDQYKKSVDLAPDNSAYRTGLADAYLQIKELDIAIATYQEVISPTINAGYASPEYVPAWIGLGNAYLTRGQDQDYQRAKKTFAEASRLQPENGQAYYGCARTEVSLGNFPAATQCLRRAISLNANLIGRAESEPAFTQISDLKEIVSATQSLHAGNLLASEGNLEEALEKYKDAIAKDDTVAVYHASLGEIYYRLQRLSDAKKEFTNAIELAPDNGSYYYKLGIVYHEQSKYDLAVAKFNQAIMINEGNAIYYASLGDTYWQMDKMDDASRVYEQAVNLDAGNLDFRYRLAELYRTQESKFQDAIQIYDMILDDDPEYNDAHCGLGIAYKKNNQFQAAIRELEICGELSQNENLKEQAKNALQELKSELEGL